MSKHFTDKELKARAERFKDALKMQEIEGNPLGQEEVEMFEMFVKKDWSDKQCLQYLLERARKDAEE